MLSDYILRWRLLAKGSKDLRSVKEIPHCLLPAPIEPPLPAMLGCIMNHMAPLAKRGQVRWIAVPWLMVEVRAREHHLRVENGRAFTCQRNATTEPITPKPIAGIEPASVAQMANDF